MKIGLMTGVKSDEEIDRFIGCHCIYSCFPKDFLSTSMTITMISAVMLIIRGILLYLQMRNSSPNVDRSKVYIEENTDLSD
ncbi:hypothetical protein BHU72_12120 [Desulfuribacillus stibiiarsenatis]|uniref:Uncharacterized protein n=1 Tax=Desulfuribacillus stibiiarsenatis TaxID=1390249 RepID=A0A1E5L213_9FIRM|nr:hypothetical protein [Desulfuribacillus stibiiarsenatis]OEH84146.1 hypothetical protein BHU72_12120 [Desulfuribacillus stibiiarsenatis]